MLLTNGNPPDNIEVDGRASGSLRYRGNLRGNAHWLCYVARHEAVGTTTVAPGVPSDCHRTFCLTLGRPALDIGAARVRIRLSIAAVYEPAAFAGVK